MWRYASSSITGLIHINQESSCQDSHICKTIILQPDNETLVAIASDGAGSAEFAKAGADFTCMFFDAQIYEHLKQHPLSPTIDEQIIKLWIQRFHESIKNKSRELGCETREMACTLLMAIVNINSAFFVQIGDGAIVYSLEDQMNSYKIAFWPSANEFVNLTHFITDTDSCDKLMYTEISNKIDEIIMFTDGLQRLALDYTNRRPHIPFFKMFIEPLRRLDKGQTEQYSHQISQFLTSPEVITRTDDDITLILASRAMTIPFDNQQ